MYIYKPKPWNRLRNMHRECENNFWGITIKPKVVLQPCGHMFEIHTQKVCQPEPRPFARACVFVFVCKRGVTHSLSQSRTLTFQQRPCRVCGSAVQWLESVYDTQRVALDPVGSLRQRLTSGAPA
jgi:hypothetical protein